MRISFHVYELLALDHNHFHSPHYPMQYSLPSYSCITHISYSSTNYDLSPSSPLQATSTYLSASITCTITFLRTCTKFWFDRFLFLLLSCYALGLESVFFGEFFSFWLLKLDVSNDYGVWFFFGIRVVGNVLLGPLWNISRAFVQFMDNHCAWRFPS